MKAHTLFNKAAAGLATVALALFMGACSHHTSVAQDQQGYGQMRTEQSAQNDTTSGTTVATAPAPSNTQASASNPGTPAVISGPAQVDNTGRVYTSSAAGGAGNAAAVGLNTNVNIVPKNGSSSTVSVSEQTPAPAPIVTSTTETATITTQPVETTPAPVYTPAPTVESTPAPMISSTESTTTQETTTTTTTKHHRRMRKD